MKDLDPDKVKHFVKSDQGQNYLRTYGTIWDSHATNSDFSRLGPLIQHLLIYGTVLIKIMPAVLSSLIKVQIDGKRYHNMTFVCNEIRFSVTGPIYLTSIILSNSLDLCKAWLFDQSIICCDM